MPITENKTDPTLSVRDIWRAAVLLAQGVPMVDAPADENGVEFVFDNTNDIAKLASAAMLDDRPIGIRTYLECHRRVRELLYQNRIVRQGRDSRRPSTRELNRNGIRKLEDVK